jgi:hypothetical protein
VNCRGVPLFLKSSKNGFKRLKLRKDSINGSVNSSMKKREGEIDQNQAPNKI